MLNWLGASVSGQPRRLCSGSFRAIISPFCSLAFQRHGQPSRLSEDLAQETFVTAWKELCQTARTGKIARLALRHRPLNLIHNFLRKGRTRTEATRRSRLRKSPNRIRPARCRPNRRSATRNWPFYGVRWNASRKFTASRSFCFIANTNPSNLVAAESLN